MRMAPALIRYALRFTDEINWRKTCFKMTGRFAASSRVISFPTIVVFVQLTPRCDFVTTGETLENAQFRESWCRAWRSACRAMNVMGLTDV